MRTLALCFAWTTCFAAAAAAPNEGARLQRYTWQRNETPTEFRYGLNVLAPWPGGGKVIINFPEHLEYQEIGMGILRHHDRDTRGRWEVAADGMSAALDVESTTAPGVRVRGTARVVAGNRVAFTMAIHNGGNAALPMVKPLYCFHYRHLTGFPQWIGNLQHTYTVLQGKPVPLCNLPVPNPESRYRAATVAGCTQRDLGIPARDGGLSASDVEAAVVAVTALDGVRKLILAWTPGKSILSNASIPCVHADPYYGTIAPGESAVARGILLFTAAPLEAVMADFLKEGAGAPPAARR
ncbi:MAG: hypothetical protein QHJ73_08985 [Armatimonadota bacterium]|nr:hypothetical protein [Armatimonadota bacterium]